MTYTLRLVICRIAEFKMDSLFLLSYYDLLFVCHRHLSWFGWKQSQSTGVHTNAHATADWKVEQFARWRQRSFSTSWGSYFFWFINLFSHFKVIFLIFFTFILTVPVFGRHRPSKRFLTLQRTRLPSLRQSSAKYSRSKHGEKSCNFWHQSLFIFDLLFFASR